MKQIRKHIFETNSSSTHSVAFWSEFCSNKPDSNLDYYQLDQFVDPADHYIHIPIGEFGWGYDEYTDAYTKLQYLLTMILETNKFSTLNQNGITCLEDLYRCDDFLLLESIITENVQNCKGINVICNEMTLHCYDATDENGNPIKGGYISHDGYIDHQSYERYHCLADFLEDWDVEIENFIFDENIMLVIDNDNG